LALGTTAWWLQAADVSRRRCVVRQSGSCSVVFWNALCPSPSSLCRDRQRQNGELLEWHGEGEIEVWARLRERAEQLKLETWTVYLAYQDPRTPWYARLLAMGVVAYALSPVDLIPDFLPVVGHLDDLVLVPLGIALAIKAIPAQVMADCRERARTEMDRRRPVSWGVAVAIVVVWGLLIAMLV